MALTIAAIAWAAGFLEGEGTFTGYIVKNGNHLRTNIQAAQVQLEPLLVLQKLFGGHIWYDKKINQIMDHPNYSPAYRWTLGGPKGRGLMMTIFYFMSPKRKQQIKGALQVWRSREQPDYIKRRAING